MRVFKITIDTRDNEIVDWLTKEMDPLSFKFVYSKSEIHFYNREDYLFYLLRFTDLHEVPQVEDANF